MPIDDAIRPRSDHGAKERAAGALADMGLSISDAIRLLMLGVGEPSSPLAANAPSTIASRGIADERRQESDFARIADFMADLRNEGFRPD